MIIICNAMGSQPTNIEHPLLNSLKYMYSKCPTKQWFLVVCFPLGGVNQLCAPFFRCADGLQPQSPGEQHIEVIDVASGQEALALPPVDHIASGGFAVGSHGKPMECSKSMENMSEKKQLN